MKVFDSISSLDYYIARHLEEFGLPPSAAVVSNGCYISITSLLLENKVLTTAPGGWLEFNGVRIFIGQIPSTTSEWLPAKQITMKVSVKRDVKEEIMKQFWDGETK